MVIAYIYDEVDGFECELAVENNPMNLVVYLYLIVFLLVVLCVFCCYEGACLHFL